MSTNIGDEARLYSPRLKLTTGDRYRLFRKKTSWTPDGPVQMTGEFANKRDRLGKMLTRASRDLSVTTNTPQGYRNVTQYGGNAENFAQEVAGSTYRSAEMQFYVDDGSVILDAQLRFVITGYRVYERDTNSGGGVATTSGASSASSSGSSDANGFSETGAGTIHYHTFANWVSNTPTPAVSRHYTDGLGTHYNIDGSNQNDLRVYPEGAHTHAMYHTHGISHTHSVSVPSHTHAQTYDIFEDTTTPGPITVKLDGVSINSFIGGPFSVSLGQTVDVSLTGAITTPGWHKLRFETSSGKGRITPYVIVKSLQLQ